MSVVGIDFGNLNTIVAVARKGGIDVIVNETSNRATPSLVGLSDKQRFLGEAAKNLEVSNFRNTAGSLKRLAGLPFAHPQLVHEKPFINCQLCEGDAGQIAASVSFLGEQRDFTYSELCAMFLVKVKEFTTSELGVPVTDCVISCPTWFSDIQRRALLDAAQVAGLNCLRLMNDLSAAALGYGITKTDLPDPELKEAARNVCFVDLGHSSYQVAIVSFVKGKLVIKGTAYDANLGGRDYDQVLVKHYSAEFKQKYKIDIASNAKATFRLRQGAEKVKKILSANPAAMLNIECIMDDKDVSAQVKRDEFLEWARPLSERLIKPIQEALTAAGMTIDDVHFIELVGGSTRLPVVKETLATFFGGSLDGTNKLATTLNQDEAVARGCALQCAILSPVFKVRDFDVQDWNGTAMELSWDASQMPPAKEGVAQITKMDAFPIGNPIPSSKILTFFRALDPAEVASGNGEVELEIKGRYTSGDQIGSWIIKGIKQLASTETKDADGLVISAKATIKVKARLDGNGLLGLESATQIEELPVPDDKTKKIVKRHELTITSRLCSAPTEIVQKWIAAEGAMYVADRLVIDTAEKRNALEEYVYEVRSKLEMAWTEYMPDAPRTEFYKSLGSMEEWLYTEEGENATKSLFIEKLAELKKIGDPVAYRASQASDRPFAAKGFRDYVNMIKLEISASTDDDRYAHIPAVDLKGVEAECQKKLKWLSDTLAQQDDTPKHSVPLITSDSIERELMQLKGFVGGVLSRPKPKPVVVEPPVAKPETTDEKKSEVKPEDVNAPAAPMDVD